MEKIFFKDSSGRSICGKLSNNDSDTAVLICHGLGGHKDSSPYDKFQKRIHSLGHGVLSIDLLGHGESDGGYNDLTLTEAIDDIICAKRELHKRGYDNVGFIGFSFGGVGGIMVAATEQFHFLILISPPTYYDISEMVSSGIYVLWELRKHNKKVKDKPKASIKIGFFKDYGSHDSYAAADKINSPTLIIHGDSDRIVPLNKSRELRKHIKGSKMKIFKGADHHYSHPAAEKKLIEETMKFIIERT
ncbi:MAG: alpha/beta hydrolase family protein [Candidatus Woesearchaeota archaeon]